MKRFSALALAVPAFLLAAPALAQGECGPTAATGTVPGGAEVTATSAVAGSLLEGRAYTIYLADYELTLDSFSAFSVPQPPEGGTVWTVALTIFNAPDPAAVPVLEAGQVIEAGRPFGELTFVVTALAGGSFAGNGTGQAGTVTLTSVGEVLCGTIEYSDGEKSLSGTFAAPTKPV